MRIVKSVQQGCKHGCQERFGRERGGGVVGDEGVGSEEVGERGDRSTHATRGGARTRPGARTPSH